MSTVYYEISPRAIKERRLARKASESLIRNHIMARFKPFGLNWKDWKKMKVNWSGIVQYMETHDKHVPRNHLSWCRPGPQNPHVAALTKTILKQYTDISVLRIVLEDAKQTIFSRAPADKETIKVVKSILKALKHTKQSGYIP